MTLPLLEQTLTLLNDAKLSAMARHLARWCRHPANLDKSCIEGLHAAALAQTQARLTRRTETFLTRARLPRSVSLNAVQPCPGLSARRLANLATCAWVDGGGWLVITGDHGSGKTFLAGALAREAALTRPSVHYHVLSRLLAGLGKDDAKVKKTLGQLQRARLLVLDQFAEEVISEHHGALLRDLLDIRKGKRATVIVSAKPADEWPLAFENPDTGSAIMHLVFGGERTLITLSNRKEIVPVQCRRARSRNS